MLYKLPLKNRLNEYVVLCNRGYDLLIKTGMIKFGEDKIFRKHSAGYAVYQHWINDECQTIYLHKFIAQHCILKPKTNKRLFVRMKNGNKLDCRIENLEWVTMGMLRRHMKPVETKTGYRGVIKDKNSYRSVLNVNGERINLGTFKTAEDAARAYNQKSKELFGVTKSLNKIKGKQIQ